MPHFISFLSNNNLSFLNFANSLFSGSFFPYPSSQAPINPQVNCISISNCILKHGSLCALSSVLCDKVDQETMREVSSFPSLFICH